ncbi:MAG TPA: DUF790 family protein [Planctomycetota bacterium]|nr:DUF790 family protein [Planctomycetota bacterium]
MRTDSVGPLPARLLSPTLADGELVPAWFSDRDRPWLRDLLHETEAAAGRPFAELGRRWRASDPDPRAGRRLAVARHVARALLLAAARPPRLAAIRQQLFAAAASGLARDEALREVAAAHGCTPDALASDLFADLPHARRIVWPDPPPEPSRFTLLANRAIAQGVLVHANDATLQLIGASRALLRTAWLHGAGLSVDRVTAEGVHLRWSRAAGCRRRARSLAALVPLLPWTRRHVLRARCAVNGLDGTLVLTTGDAILPGPEPRPYDSELERCFARDFAAAAPGFELLREPTPLATGDHLAFPDFELRCRSSGRRWLLEIAGLRDRSVLPGKLALLDREPDYLLCVPRQLVPAGLVDHPRVVGFGRRVTVAAVLDRIAAQRRIGGPRAGRR